jgi:hypothetical protein
MVRLIRQLPVFGCFSKHWKLPAPSHHISYSAPSGFHDDCVMALALANHRRWETESCGPMMPPAPKGRFSPFAAQPRIMAG